MQVVEAIYKEGEVILIKPYNKINSSARVVVLFMDQEEVSLDEERIINLAKLQESTGFAKEILGNSAEDVWNDL